MEAPLHIKMNTHYNTTVFLSNYQNTRAHVLQKDTICVEQMMHYKGHPFFIITFLHSTKIKCILKYFRQKQHSWKKYGIFLFVAFV